MNNSSNKTFIIIIIVAIVGAIGYFYFKGGSSANSGSLVAENPETSAVAAQTLSLLNQINSLRIDTSLFKDPAYQTLRDYTVPIPSVNVGRLNPFAPVPGMPGAGTGSGGARGTR